jgi:hypothetical protein
MRGKERLEHGHNATLETPVSQFISPPTPVLGQPPVKSHNKTQRWKDRGPPRKANMLYLMTASKHEHPT